MYLYEYGKEKLNIMIHGACMSWDKFLASMEILKKVYHFEIYAIFHIDCYIDDDYGIILEINKDSSPFFLYSKI